jgi:hypothetical protein
MITRISEFNSIRALASGLSVKDIAMLIKDIGKPNRPFTCGTQLPTTGRIDELSYTNGYLSLPNGHPYTGIQTRLVTDSITGAFSLNTWIHFILPVRKNRVFSNVVGIVAGNARVKAGNILQGIRSAIMHKEYPEVNSEEYQQIEQSKYVLVNKNADQYSGLPHTPHCGWPYTLINANRRTCFGIYKTNPRYLEPEEVSQIDSETQYYSVCMVTLDELCTVLYS